MRPVSERPVEAEGSKLTLFRIEEREDTGCTLRLKRRGDETLLRTVYISVGSH